MDVDVSLCFYWDGFGLKECLCYDSELGCFILIFLVMDEDIVCVGFELGFGKVFDGMFCVELIYNWDLEEYGGGWNFGYFVYCVENIYEICVYFDVMGYMINCLLCDGYMVFVCLLDGIFVEFF